MVSQRLRAVFLADDDGSHRVLITPAEVAAWVAEANEIYRPSGIRIDFDPAHDWELMNSTVLNTLTGDDNPIWALQKSVGNGVAAQTPDRMVVFFRWGNVGGFSWTDYDFIAMPGFSVTWVCGHQNIGLLAHEAGHYLGLAHSFPFVWGSTADAQSYFTSHGDDPMVFDGDGRSDTAPDPFVNTTQVQCSSSSLTLDGVQFPLPRSNTMSYYYPISDLAASQTWTMRQVLLLRTGQGLANIVSEGAVHVEEGEGHTPTITGGWFANQSMGSFLGRWSGNAQLIWIDASPGKSLTMTFSVPQAGSYDVYASFTAAPDYGIHTHYVNGHAGATVDLYSNGVLVTGPIFIGRFDLAAGANQWRAVVTSANGRANPRYGYGLDYILVSAPGVDPAGARHGDANGDGLISVTDVFYLINALFAGGPPPATTCRGDVNGDGAAGVADVFYLINYLFAGGPMPPSC